MPFTYTFKNTISGNNLDAGQELLQKLCNKDLEAFSTFYDEYAPLLFGVIVKRTSNKSIAEKILKEAFTRFWNELSDKTFLKGSLLTRMMGIVNELSFEMTDARGSVREVKILSGINSNYSSEVLQ